GAGPGGVLVVELVAADRQEPLALASRRVEYRDRGGRGELVGRDPRCHVESVARAAAAKDQHATVGGDRRIELVARRVDPDDRLHGERRRPIAARREEDVVTGAAAATPAVAAQLVGKQAERAIEREWIAELADQHGHAERRRRVARHTSRVTTIAGRGVGRLAAGQRIECDATAAVAAGKGHHKPSSYNSSHAPIVRT